MKRVLVIGSGGSGKTTLSRSLGQKLNVPVVHLDQLYWSAGWVEMPKQEWSRVVDDLLLRDEWIIDGNYSGTLEKRIAKCDTIIFLDMSSILCLWRIVKRRFLYRRGTRPDMAEGCEEHLNLKFALWVLNYPRK